MHYRLVFSGPIHERSSMALQSRIAVVFEQANYESLTVVFSSEGGSTVHGLALYNVIRLLPRPIVMHAIGHVGSMAIPVFLAGHARTCSPFSRFFFHGYDWTFDGKQNAERIAEATQLLNSDIKVSAEIAAKHTTISPDKIALLYRTSPEPAIFTPAEAKEAGIVSEVLELNPTGKAEPNVAIWTVGW